MHGADLELYRAIRTSQLRALPPLHTWPINVMVYHGPQGDLVLRWVSRLDAFSGYPVHTIATRLRGWRHDRSTRGVSIPVLSY